MKKWAFLIFILILGTFETGVLGSFKLFGVKPDFLLICVVIASLTFEPKWIFVFSIFAGIFKDILSINKFGIDILLFPFWGFLIFKLSKKISLDNIYLRVVLIFLVCLLNNVALKVIFFYLGRYIPLGSFLRITFLESLYTALISFPFLKINLIFQ